MRAANSIFLDSNVLVYATIAQSPLYPTAQKAITDLKQAGTETWISRQVLREYLATLTRPQTFLGIGKPIPVPTLTAEVRHFQSQYRIAEEVHQVTEELLNLMFRYSAGGKQVHDANIVATMIVYGISHLLTHNVTDFNRFTDVITLVPLV